jgi:hypothetical protein
MSWLIVGIVGSKSQAAPGHPGKEKVASCANSRAKQIRAFGPLSLQRVFHQRTTETAVMNPI